MTSFSYKEIYLEDNRRVLEINILPDKYCNFDCIFCPIGRGGSKTDTAQSFEGTEEAIAELSNILDNNPVDLVFINSKGEALINDKILSVIEVIKSKGKAIKLLTNGYILGIPKYSKVAQLCDEVIGEIKILTEDEFQKIQRPMDGYTLEKHVEGMAAFKQHYEGVFILEVTILKGYDTDESIRKTKSIIAQIAPDRLLIERITEDPFKKKLGVSDERYDEICRILRL